jgi:hypothetical protein
MRIMFVALLLAAATVAGAQEGFPLDGTWRGERPSDGRGKGKDAHVTIVMVLQWDGQKITGSINPGPNAIPIAAAQLVPEGWHVKLAATNKAGKPIAFEGTIADLGAYNRAIAGTWTEGGRSWPLRMVRE